MRKSLWEFLFIINCIDMEAWGKQYSCHKTDLLWFFCNINEKVHNFIFSIFNDLEKLYWYKYRNYPFHLPCVVYYIVRSFRRLATQIENVNKIVAAVLMQYNSLCTLELTLDIPYKHVKCNSILCYQGKIQKHTWNSTKLNYLVCNILV